MIPSCDFFDSLVPPALSVAVIRGRDRVRVRVRGIRAGMGVNGLCAALLYDLFAFVSDLLGCVFSPVKIVPPVTIARASLLCRLLRNPCQSLHGGTYGTLTLTHPQEVL